MAGTPQQPGSSSDNSNGRSGHQYGYPPPGAPQPPGGQGPQPGQQPGQQGWGGPAAQGPGPQGYGAPRPAGPSGPPSAPPGGGTAAAPGMPAPPPGPPPAAGPWPSRPPGPPPSGGGGFQDGGAWSTPSASPYPQASPYGHFQQYGHATGPMPAPGAPQRPGRSRKTMITWVSVITSGVVAAVVGTLLVGDPVEENRRENAQQIAAPSIPAFPSSMPNPTATATRPGGVTAADQMVIPSAPPKVTGAKWAITAEASTWPDACEVLTDEEITAAIPESKVVKRAGRKDSIIGNTPKNNECRIDLTFPGLIDAERYPAWITVEVWGVDKLSFDPKSGSVNAQQAQERFTRSKQSSQRVNQDSLGGFDDLGKKLGADDSFRERNTIDMIKGAFKLNLVFNAQMEDTGGNPLPGNTFCKLHGAALAMVAAAKM